MTGLTTLLLKLPRNTEITPESSQTLLAALTQINGVSRLQKMLGTKPQAFALEIALDNQQIKFIVTCDDDLVPFVTTQIQSNYPLVIIEKIKDPIEGKQLDVAALVLSHGSYYPLAVTDNFKEVDPLSSVLSVLSKGDPDQLALIQISLESAGTSWQSAGADYASKGTKNEDGGYSPRSDESIIKEKITYPGFMVSIRLASNSKIIINELKSAFGVFTRADGNSFKSKKIRSISKKSEVKNLHARLVNINQVMNIVELATVWHLPSDKIKTSAVVWGTSVLSEPPSNLPAAMDTTDEEKKDINFFAKTLHKNTEATFGIKIDDRRRHIWAIGKTGTGKSTLIANMAIDDIKKGRGVAIIDPHGDLCETLLDYIPKNRINDVVYFNPADGEYPISINPLEVRNIEEAELVASGLLSIFTKLWANVWSARMEYIIRNAFLTLAYVPNSTLADVLKILSNRKFRDSVVAKLEDPNLVHYWEEEFNKMPDRLQKEAIAPIQNKVGQFVTSPMARKIIGSPQSSINIDEIMNNGQILLANLSQGRIGEDNANLLGAMLITKIQLSAMHRVDMSEKDRRDFYLYVDEFQNFATTSFVKILSEARKYRLNLMLANQYMAQVPEEIQKAILGNAGTIISFSAGAEDALILHKEFAEVFSQNDLVSMRNFQIATKLMIDGHSTRPFLANTLPLPASRNKNRQKVIAVSRERWGRKYVEPPPEEKPIYTPEKPKIQFTEAQQKNRWTKPGHKTSR